MRQGRETHYDQIDTQPREKIAKMACFNKPNQLRCIYKPY